MSLLTANQCVPTPITVAQDGAGKGDLIKISLEQSILRKIPCSTMYSLSHVTVHCLFSSPISVVQCRARKGDLFKISLEEMFSTKRPLVECLTVDLEEKNKTLSIAKTKAVTAEFESKLESLGIAMSKPRKSRKRNSFPLDMTAPPSISRELRSASVFSETGSRESKATVAKSSPIPPPKITKKKTAPCSNWQRGTCKATCPLDHAPELFNALQVCDQQIQARKKQKKGLKDKPMLKQPLLQQSNPKKQPRKQLLQVLPGRNIQGERVHPTPIPCCLEKLIPEMPSATREAVEAILRHKFKRPETLWIALQVDQQCVKKIGEDQSLPDGNMSMAMYGDGILKLALLDYWYFDTEWSRSEGTRFVQQRETNRYLADKARTAGLDRYLNIKRKTTEHELGSIVEALLAAVHIDTEHMEPVMRAMVGLGLIPKRRERALITIVKPFKEQAKFEKKKSAENFKKVIEEIEEAAKATGAEKVQKVKEEERRTDIIDETTSPTPVLEDHPKDNAAFEDIISTKVECPKPGETRPEDAKVEVLTKKEATKKESKIRRFKKRGLTWLEKKFKIRVSLKT